MDMTYNHMPTWIFSTDLNSHSKLILERLFSLSKDGSQIVFCTRKKLKELFNISLSTISRCFRELVDKGFLENAQNPDKFSQVRYFKITDKALAKTAPSEGDENTSEQCQFDKPPLSNSDAPLVKKRLSSIDRSLGRVECEFFCEEKKSKMTNDEVKEWLSVPAIDEAELKPEVKEVKAVPVKETKKEATAPTTTPLTMNRLPAASVKEKSSAKREKAEKMQKVRKPMPIPTVQEVEDKMIEWAQKHVEAYPVLAHFDPKLEAENFCNYWENCGWMRGKEHMYSLGGSIGYWLTKALKEGRLLVKQRNYNPAQDYRRTGLTREMNQEIANNIVPKAIEFAERLKQAEQQQTPRRHVDEIEQLENEQFKKLGVL